MDEWRLTVDASSRSELQDLLGGLELHVGGEGKAQRTEKIATVESFGIGYDAYCMFGFVKVTCESSEQLLLYTDGAIHDLEDVKIGRHDLTLTTVDGREALARKRTRSG